jgi:hypothetical protein
VARRDSPKRCVRHVIARCQREQAR